MKRPVAQARFWKDSETEKHSNANSHLGLTNECSGRRGMSFPSSSCPIDPPPLIFGVGQTGWSTCSLPAGFRAMPRQTGSESYFVQDQAETVSHDCGDGTVTQ